MLATTATNKMFCKFCYDSGRGDFDNHNTRARDGRLTCKYLASISCTRCGNNGHTVKYCRENYITDCDKSGGDWNVVAKGKMATASGYRSKKENVNKMLSMGGAFSALIIDDGCEDCMQDCVEDKDNKCDITWANASKVFNSDNHRRLSWADIIENGGDIPLSKTPQQIRDAGKNVMPGLVIS